jgi:Tol biopolymer transport system component
MIGTTRVQRGYCSALLLGILIPLGALAQTHSSATDQSFLKGEPHLFGAGVISTPDAEANASFTPDGATFYFAKHNPGWSHTTIVLSHRRGKTWAEPEVAPFSGLWTDTDPSVSADGRKLFFASNRPTSGGQSAKKDLDLWYVARTTSGSWGQPQRLSGAVNSDGMEASPSVTRDGTLYFESSRPTDHPGPHIYRSRPAGDEFGPPEILPFSKEANDMNPVVAPDESFIIFFSRDRGGLGGGDLFVSFHRADGSWSSPKNLGSPINSSFLESAPGLSPDGRTLYFTSDRIDGPATRARRVNYRELEHELHAIQNGLSNIYAVDISDLQVLNDTH